jgi:hypothetical protein
MDAANEAAKKARKVFEENYKKVQEQAQKYHEAKDDTEEAR